MSNQVIVDIEVIKDLIRNKGYYKYKRESNKAGEKGKSIEEHYSLTNSQATEMFKDERLKGLRRNKSYKKIVFKQDLEPQPEESSSEETQNTEQEKPVEKIEKVETEQITPEEETEESSNTGEENAFSDIDIPTNVDSEQEEQENKVLESESKDTIKLF